MSDLPPPLPSYASSNNHNGFASGAATACLLAPLLVIGLGQVLKHLGSTLPGPNLALAALAVGGVSCLLMLAGLILGILALLLMRPGGRASIVTRSLLGLAATSLLVAIAVPNFLQARAQAKARQSALSDVQTALADLHAQSAASLTNQGRNGTNLNGVLQARLDRVEQSLGAAAQTTTDDLAAVLKAGQAYTRHLQAVMADYQGAHDTLISASVLATSNLVDRATIADRQAVVQRFLVCNEALKDFLGHGSSNFQAELVAFHVSNAKTASALAGFEKPAAIQKPILMDIRAQDDRLGAAMLGVLGLLDTNWGRWHYSTNAPHLRFEDRTALNQYNAFLAEIHDAGQAQVAAQRQLAGLIQQTASR